MKYIAICYNYLTLARVLKYTNTEWKKENTYIIFINLLFDLPMSIVSDYSIQTIECVPQSAKLTGFSLLNENCIEANKTWTYIDDIISNSNSNFTIVVFKDNEAIECSVIERAKHKFSSRIKVMLFEEGTGLYANNVVPVRFSLVKKIFYKLKKVSSYCVDSHSQGENPLVDVVVCTKPSLFLKKKQANFRIEEMKQIFTHEINQYLIKSVLGDVNSTSKVDFVFLTQPFKDWKEEYMKLEETHNVMLPKIFEILKNHGTTVIKLHPREHYDYSKFKAANISVASEMENLLPFECLMELYGNPQLISMFSSTAINIKTSKKSIYLGKLFDFPIMDKLFSSDFYHNNNIVMCETIEMFEESLISEMKG